MSDEERDTLEATTEQVVQPDETRIPVGKEPSVDDRETGLNIKELPAPPPTGQWP